MQAKRGLTGSVTTTSLLATFQTARTSGLGFTLADGGPRASYIGRTAAQFATAVMISSTRAETFRLPSGSNALLRLISFTATSKTWRVHWRNINRFPLLTPVLHHGTQMDFEHDPHEPPEDWDTELTAREGVHAAGMRFSKALRWFFRETNASDRGIDAYAESTETVDGKVRLVALQIKSGKSYFRKRGSDFVYYGKRKHLEYWSVYPIPVFIILYDPDKELLLWQLFDEQKCKMHRVHWSIAIPRTNILNEAALATFRNAAIQQPAFTIRSQFEFDDELIGYAAETDVFFIWEVWLNDQIPVRSLKIFIDDIRPKPDLEIDFEIYSDDIQLIMRRLYPWATYTYDQPIEMADDHVALHILKVKPRPAALAFLEAERFFAEGVPAEARPVPPPRSNG